MVLSRSQMGRVVGSPRGSQTGMALRSRWGMEVHYLRGNLTGTRMGTVHQSPLGRAGRRTGNQTGTEAPNPKGTAEQSQMGSLGSHPLFRWEWGMNQTRLLVEDRRGIHRQDRSELGQRQH